MLLIKDNVNFMIFFLLLTFAVPISATEGIKMLYVFVDIQIDIVHFVETVKHNFTAGSKLALVSTVQFISSLQVCCGSCIFALSIMLLRFIIISWKIWKFKILFSWYLKENDLSFKDRLWKSLPDSWWWTLKVDLQGSILHLLKARKVWLSLCPSKNKFSYVAW